MSEIAPDAPATVAISQEDVMGEDAATIAIPLIDGKGVTLVDQADADFALYEWNLSSNGYATRHGMDENKPIAVFLHRVILARMLGRSLGPGELTDHKNRMRLDNRRSNLRLANGSDNASNVPYKPGRWGYRGIVLIKKRGGYFAQCDRAGQRNAVGPYASPEEAAHAYDALARQLHGEFATLNFPDSL